MQSLLLACTASFLRFKLWVLSMARMLDHIRYNYSRYGNGADIEVDIDLSRFEKQYGEAQFKLDSIVMTDMVPYMPMQTGTFINVTKAISASIAGSGYVCAAAPPMGRFLYEGNVMVDEETGSPWARKGSKKVVTNKPLEFDTSKHPKAVPHWFDEAKKNHGASWVKMAKKIAGGG